MISTSHSLQSIALVAALMLSPPALAGGQIHRCNDGGRITYTDLGCSARGEATIVGMSTVAHAPVNGFSEHARSLPVEPGMSPRMVFDILGRPVETIATLQGRALVEYWLYRGVGATSRVAFQDGRVTRVDAR